MYTLIIWVCGIGTGTGCAIESINFTTMRGCQQAVAVIVPQRRELGEGVVRAACVTRD